MSGMGHVQKLAVLRAVIQEVTGQDPSPRAVIVALVRHAPRGVRVTHSVVRTLQEGQAQQDLINAAVRLAMRTHGPSVPYSTAYEDYLVRAEEAGLAPLDLKTFKNRALAEFAQAQNRDRTRKASNVVEFQTRPKVEAVG